MRIPSFASTPPPPTTGSTRWRSARIASTRRARTPVTTRRATGEEVLSYFGEVAGRLDADRPCPRPHRTRAPGRRNDGEQIRDLVPESSTMSRCAARWSTLDTWRRRFRPLTPLRSSWRRTLDSSPSTTCRRPRNQMAPTPCSGRARRRWTRAPGFLDNDVEPDRIRWVRPRDAWFHDRRHFQPLEQVGGIMEGISLDAEAGAEASTCRRPVRATRGLGAADAHRPVVAGDDVPRHDAQRRGARALRQIEDVVRLGRVRRIEADRIVLERGEVETQLRRPARRLHGARPEQRSRDADLSAGPDRAPADAPPLAVLQRSAHRLHRGPPRRRRGKEPAVPAESVPEQHRGLAGHGEPHMANGAAMVGRARPLGVGGGEPAEPACARFPLMRRSPTSKRWSSDTSRTSARLSSG